MPRGLATGFSQGLGQGLVLGKTMKGNREEARNKALDTEIAAITSEEPALTKKKGIDAPGTAARTEWDTATDKLDANTATKDDLKELPMSVRYSVDGDNQIRRVEEKLKERYGAFSPEYHQARTGFRDEIMGLQQNLMEQAAASFESGDKEQAAEMLTRAYAMFPNGKGIDIREKDGELYGIGFDMKTMKPDGTLPINSETIDYARRQMGDKDKWDTYLFKVAEEARAERADKRMEGAFTHEQSMYESERKLADSKAALAELQFQMDKDPDYGLSAQAKSDKAAAESQLLKDRAETFKATAQAWYYLDQGPQRGEARQPGGISFSDWVKVTEKLDGLLKSRTAEDVGVSPEKYNRMYLENGDKLYDFMMLNAKDMLNSGEVYDPAMIVARSEKQLDQWLTQQDASPSPDK